LTQDEIEEKRDKYLFCLKQIYKMCFYVQKVHYYEILQIRCEFMEDENGTIWFFYADQIFARPMRGNNVPVGMMSKVLNRAGLPKKQMDLIDEMAEQ